MDNATRQAVVKASSPTILTAAYFFVSAYTTQAEILGEIQQADLISLTDDNQTGNVDSTVLNQIIANASALIDAKVSNIYTVPFGAPYPNAVSNAALTIVWPRSRSIARDLRKSLRLAPLVALPRSARHSAKV